MIAIKRPIDVQKIQKGDIWLHSSRNIAGLAIRTATQSPVNHTGQIVENDYIIHAINRGLIKEKFRLFIHNPNLKITIVRIKDSLFGSPKEKENIIKSVLSTAEEMYAKHIHYDHRLLLQMGWRAGLRAVGLWRVKKVKNFMGQRRIEVICSQFIDDVWDRLEKTKNIDLFRTTIHPKEVTPKDILKSPYVTYVTGWYYPAYFEK